MRVPVRPLLTAALLAAPCLPAAAQTLAASSPYNFYEVRLGVLKHDVRFAGGREPGVDLNVDMTTSTLVNPNWGGWAPTWLQWVLHPRFNVGAEVNTAGYTNIAYAGLAWTATLTRELLNEHDAIEFTYLFGPSINDGQHHAQRPSEKSLGSNVLFHLGAEIAYRIDSRFAIGGYFDHISNGGFAKYNGSINDAGVRFAIRF